MNIRKILVTGISIFILTMGLNTALAQKSENNIGLGVIIGEPTGLSFKAWTSATNAVDAGLAWSLEGNETIHIHADYLWHDFEIFGEDIEPGQLALYYGIGGRLIFADDNPDPGDDDEAILGARVPAGLNYFFEDAPFDLFFEVAPIINLVPSTDLDADVAVGARYYF